jgi:hypothetical protein
MIRRTWRLVWGFTPTVVDDAITNGQAVGSSGPIGPGCYIQRPTTRAMHGSKLLSSSRTGGGLVNDVHN